MTQQHPLEGRDGALSAGRGTSQFIEKGWSVYDAAEHPVGNVTGVDTARNVLAIDGRPQGFGSFEIPLGLVERTSGNEVRLTRVMDTSAIGSEGAPRFMDPPAATTPPRTAAASSTTESRVRTRTEPAAMPSTAMPSTPSPRATTDTTTDPVRPGTMHEFSPPYASRHPTMGPEGEIPSWGNEDEGSWNAKKLAMAGLALGGLAAATYVMRRRMRRKTAFEQFVDMASDYFGVASEFARDRHPAWWASLAAAALPLAYYAWPSPKPTYKDQAHDRADDIASYFAGLAGTGPWMADGVSSMTDRVRRQMPSHLPSTSDLRPTWDWSPRPDVAGTLGALAAGALTIYLIRRAMSKPAHSTRIADVMTRQPRVIQPDAMVADAAAMMRRLDVGAIPVCDGTRLIGMLTDRDITTRSTADGRDPHLTPVRDVMSLGVAWATEDDLVEEAARIMREHRIRRLPIVDERHSLVGVVSLGDLAVDVHNDDLSGDTLERISEKTQKPRDW